MSKISSLSCTVTAMLVLISGMAIGADNAEAQPTKPEAANTQKPSNSNPKEEAAKPSETSSNASNEEPSCD